MGYVYTIILACIAVSRHDFICIYF